MFKPNAQRKRVWSDALQVGADLVFVCVPGWLAGLCLSVMGLARARLHK